MLGEWGGGQNDGGTGRERGTWGGWVAGVGRALVWALQSVTVTGLFCFYSMFCLIEDAQSEYLESRASVI